MRPDRSDEGAAASTVPGIDDARLRALRAVVIGGSAGAVEALVGLLSGLPPLALPLTVVVHQPAQRPSALASVLADACRCGCSEAQAKEPLRPGQVYVAPPDYHLLVDPGPVFGLSLEPPVQYSRPSIDLLFESAAEVFGASLAAVVLSGANHDGARGLRAVADAGGLALVQSPGEAGTRTMPEAALASCPSARALPLAQLRRLLGALAAPAGPADPADPAPRPGSGDNRKSHG